MGRRRRSCFRSRGTGLALCPYRFASLTPFTLGLLP